MPSLSTICPVLVAIALLATVAAMVFGSLLTTTRLVEAGRDRAAQEQTIRRVLRLMADDAGRARHEERHLGRPEGGHGGPREGRRARPVLRGVAVGADLPRVLHRARRLPADHRAIWDFLVDLGPEQRTDLFALCAGLSVNAMHTQYDRRPAEVMPHADQLAVLARRLLAVALQADNDQANSVQSREDQRNPRRRHCQALASPALP